MAATRVRKKVTGQAATEKKPIGQVRQENVKLKKQLQKYQKGAMCYLCGKTKPIGDFALDTDVNNHNHKKQTGGTARICRDCFYAICEQTHNGGAKRPITKQSLQKGLFYLNKPFLETVYDASVLESENQDTGKPRGDVARAYIKNIQMPQYVGMTWLDSDMFKGRLIAKDPVQQISQDQLIEEHMGQDAYDNFVKNKADVQRLLGYDPFEAEAIEDQPFLYSQLLGLLDQQQSQNDDLMRVSSCISIVRDFLQLQKLDDAITKLMAAGAEDVSENSATIKSLQDSKQKISSMITNLAAESCISLKNSKTATKGENTWTGKIRKIKQLNLRDGEVNGFDIATSKAMRQVMDASNKSIIQELKCDDSEWASIVADQRDMIYHIDNELSDYKEIVRILLRENIDLKDYLRNNNITFDGSLVDLDELFQDSKTYIIEETEKTEK